MSAADDAFNALKKTMDSYSPLGAETWIEIDFPAYRALLHQKTLISFINLNSQSINLRIKVI